MLARTRSARQICTAAIALALLAVDCATTTAEGGPSGSLVGFGENDEVVSRDVDGVEAHGHFEDILRIDTNHERGRPKLPRRQGDGAPDEP